MTGMLALLAGGALPVKAVIAVWLLSIRRAERSAPAQPQRQDGPEEAFEAAVDRARRMTNTVLIVAEESLRRQWHIHGGHLPAGQFVTWAGLRAVAAERHIDLPPTGEVPR